MLQRRFIWYFGWHEIVALRVYAMTHTEMLFPLEDEGDWSYQLQIYLISHSQLQIKLEHSTTGQVKYINFSGVEFYDGSLDWKGAGFFIGNSDECLEILNKIDAYRKDADEVLLSEMSLFVAEPYNGHRIRIVAGNSPSFTKTNLFKNYVP